MDGLEDFLAWADHRKLRKAAVTNAPRANSIAMLDALGLTCASWKVDDRITCAADLRAPTAACCVSTSLV